MHKKEKMMFEFDDEGMIKGRTKIKSKVVEDEEKEDY